MFDDVHPIEYAIRQEFGEDADIMIDVAFCESNLSHYNDKGEVLRGKVNPKDVGLFQISETYHLKTAEKMGLDIYTLNGNITYAKYLFEKNGLKDWAASSNCHQ
ncbi:MAG: hypothetical protein U1E54_03330 [Candidatus Levybacteria bacterium]|nr:hypothetical protein [Candidatus Levybacteria bacterium]